MNTLRKILVSITAISMLFLTSCLDDESVGIEVPDFAGSPYVVDFNEMPNSAGYVKRNLEMTDDPNKTYPTTLRINLSSPWQLTEDLVVTVKLDEAAVNKYIANNPDLGFKLLASNRVNFTEGQLIIPAGKREAELTVELKTAGIKIEDKFMMAFTITGTNNPNVILSGNFGTQYVAVGVKNFFEGKYRKKLSYFHPTAGGTYPDKPYTTRDGEATLNTVDATTCDDWLGVWTSDKVLIKINPDNSIDLAFPTRPDAFEGDPYDPTHQCVYDPATGILKVYYYYNKAAPRIFWVEYIP